MKIKLPLSAYAAVAGVGLAAFYLVTHAVTTPEQSPQRPLATSPYAHSHAGIGLIEPNDKAIRVMPYRNGKVEKVFVTVGQQVAKGQPLFQLDTSRLQAQLASQQAEAQAQRSQLLRLQNEPRPETLPALKARVNATEATYLREKDTYDRYASVVDKRAISTEELVNAQHRSHETYALWQEAKANLALKQAGSWRYEIEEAEAKLFASQKAADDIKVQLAESVVRAPFATTVLQVNIREGEYVVATQPGNTFGAREDSPILLGNNTLMQVRVDIDEVTASTLKPGQPATATVRGNAKLSFPLQFVRAEPLMIPKRNLTGQTAERVDVRVLQLIYEFAPPTAFTVYAGQQVEVFIDDAEPNQAKAPPSPQQEGA